MEIEICRFDYEFRDEELNIVAILFPNGETFRKISVDDLVDLIVTYRFNKVVIMKIIDDISESVGARAVDNYEWADYCNKH
jgi:hypothetical protein